MATHPEPITLALTTRVERKLVIATALGCAIVYLLLLWFMSLIFRIDLETEWYYALKAEMFEVPRMSEESKKQEQLKEVVALRPACYSYLYKHWHYFIVGIPLLTLVGGGILSWYRSITIRTLISYHFFFSFFTLCMVLMVVFVIMISNMPWIIRGL
jgi:hypothetical protein